jgi:hypothetical protein
MTKPVDCCTDEVLTGRTRIQTIAARARSWVLNPRGLAIAGIAIVAAGLALNWSWVVAVGAAPLILSFGPCAAMCALGLCMNMRGHAKSPVDAPGSDSGAGRSTPLVAQETSRKA